jgi:hypothetical protein
VDIVPKIRAAKELSEALGCLVRHFAADTVTLHLLEEDGMLHLKALSGQFPPPVLAIIQKIPVGKGMAGLAVERGDRHGGRDCCARVRRRPGRGRVGNCQSRGALFRRPRKNCPYRGGTSPGRPVALFDQDTFFGGTGVNAGFLATAEHRVTFKQRTLVDRWRRQPISFGHLPPAAKALRGLS